MHDLKETVRYYFRRHRQYVLSNTYVCRMVPGTYRYWKYKGQHFLYSYVPMHSEGSCMKTSPAARTRVSNQTEIFFSTGKTIHVPV